MCYPGMYDTEETIQICVQIVRAYPKNLNIINSGNAIIEGKSIYSCHYQGVSPKISFLLLPIYDCMFSRTPCLRVMKIGDFGDKSMQIPNKTVNLLSEQALTMNL